MNLHDHFSCLWLPDKDFFNNFIEMMKKNSMTFTFKKKKPWYFLQLWEPRMGLWENGLKTASACASEVYHFCDVCIPHACLFFSRAISGICSRSLWVRTHPAAWVSSVTDGFGVWAKAVSPTYLYRDTGTWGICPALTCLHLHTVFAFLHFTQCQILVWDIYLSFPRKVYWL